MSRVLLEKLTGFQLVEKFSEFFGTRRFITAFTRARHLSLSWARSIQYMALLTSLRYILILSSHLFVGLPSGLFSSDFPTKALYDSLLSSIRATCTAHLILLGFIVRIVFGEEYRSVNSSLCSLHHSLVTLAPPRTKYAPQYPVLERSLPMCLPLYERPTFTHVQKKKKLYSCIS